MKIVILLLHIHLLYLVTACPPALRKSINNLNYQLYKACAPKKQNLVYSPIGVHFLLYLTAEYSTYNKAALFYKNLQMQPISADIYRKFWSRLSTKKPSITIEFSNKLYIRGNLTLRKTFNDKTVPNFGIFVTKQLKELDQSVSKHVPPSTDMVLLNQAIFKGRWFTHFQRRTTKLDVFHTTRSTTVQCQMIYYNGNGEIRDDPYLGARIIRLKYDTEPIFMYLLVPHTMEGLAAMEMKLINASTSGEAGISFLNPDTMQLSKVALAIPKFKFTRTIDLTSPLTEMGFGDTFADPQALDIINSTIDPHLTKKLLQTVTVEVGEDVNPEPARSNSLPGRGYKIVANHPFIFYVTAWTEAKEHLIMFSGKLTKPIL